MSTKTTFKRIALVAVASLGLRNKGTAAATTVASGIVANTITGMTVTASGAGALVLNLTGNPAGTAAKGRITIGGTTISGATSTSATTDTNMVIPFTAPVTAGTYTASVQYTDGGTYSGTGADTITQSFTLTVSAASGLSTALSTAYAGPQGAAAASYTATTNAVARTGVRTAGTGLATIEVTLKNANGTAHAAGSEIRASITGSGYVLADTTATTAASSIGTARSVAVDASGAGLAYVHVAADGTSGTGTVTVTVTDAATDAVTTLGTFTVTSYGPVAKLEVSTSNYTIGRAGFTTGVASTTRVATTEIGNALNTTATITVISGTSTTPAFIVKATDAAGSVVNLTNTLGNAAVPTVISDNIAVSGGGTCALDGGASTVSSSTNGVGFYNCSFSIAPTAVSGGKATLTIRTPNPADTTTFLTATYAISVGGSVSTETIAFDKATYEPGEAMVVTRTAVDSAGNSVWDGAAAPAITFNKALGGSAIGASIYVGGKRATSATTPTVFAPVVTGAFTGRATSGNAAATALTATATVADDAATTAAGSAAADAAAEATDAANAATDAANAAAEAADAATAAAQDAADAVAALSASVSAMVSDLKKQITSLTNLVIKIQKKVRA
jgi:trimeric autotransporter adhesin